MEKLQQTIDLATKILALLNEAALEPLEAAHVLRTARALLPVSGIREARTREFIERETHGAIKFDATGERIEDGAATPSPYPSDSQGGN